MIIDLTKTIEDGMPVYPGDPKVSLTPIAEVEKDGYENHLLMTSMHSGTHIDGPKHFIQNQPYIDTFPLDTFIGKARLIDDIQPYHYEGESILFIHSNGYLSVSFVQSFLNHPIRVIVLEGTSPDEAPYLIHQSLLGAGVFIVENATNFDQLPFNQTFKAYIIPLKIHADSSPCRVFVET